MPDGLVELVPDRLYRLGGAVPRDGRITWVPPKAGGYEPLNCFLLTNGRSALLVDAGVGLFGDRIAEQMASVIGDDTGLTVFLTRMEPDVVTGLGAILPHFRVERVCAGGSSNPFDYFDDLNSSTMVRAAYQATLKRFLPEETLHVGDDRPVSVVPPPLRLLMTSWLYDERTSTLFTSDSFGYVGTPDRESPPVVEAGSDPITREEVKEHLLTKHAYLEGARTQLIVDRLEELDRTRRIDRIASTHGCVLNDRPTVSRHLRLMAEILTEVGVSQG
jgi:flavorubredoxin